MQKDFLSNLLKIIDQPRTKHFLLAVSGGLDSMVMVDLFHKAELPFGIIHCNFTLRGKESDEDARFVKKMAKQYKAPFYLKKFRTEEYAKKSGLSIQMAARKLRYDWFEEIRAEFEYDFVVTAHHLDDQIETFFINLLRGTGIAGLHGILPIKGQLLRPMLFTYREEIKKYAEKKHLPYRDDSSNDSLKYTRNQIRHQVIPVLRTIQPDFSVVMTETIEKIRDFEIIGKAAIFSASNSLVHKEGKQITISIEALKNLVPLRPYAYELFAPLGFSLDVIENLLKILDGNSGKTFFSSTHRLIKDRKNLIITEISDAANDMQEIHKEFNIEAEVNHIEKPVKLKFKVQHLTPGFIIPTSLDSACLDYDKLKFPLSIRKWKAGDAFCPLGMNQKKKLSDFFIDQKFTLTEKETTWLLCSGDHITWVIGHRIDHRFRITPRTKKMLYVMLLP